MSLQKQYDLYRVYAINGDGGRLRIAEDIRGFAKTVAAGVGGLPAKVRPDSFSVDPAALTWGPEISIKRPDDPEDNEA